jgi:hypothetical protein
MASNNPAFEEKAADIIARYMNPPQHAAVFCVDENTAIQELAPAIKKVLPALARTRDYGFRAVPLYLPRYRHQRFTFGC